VLGAAWIAEVAVLPAIAASRNGRLVALASRHPERARQMLERYPNAKMLGTYDEVLADPNVDSVYIPLVNNLHKEWTIRAFEAGKHVLCEKPLAMNAEEAEVMAAAARSANKQLMEAFMYRFQPGMREFVQSVPDPIHVAASFGFTLGGGPNYRRQAELGGGALLDVGCYTVSVSRWIMGEPVDVLARSRTEGGVDMSVSALLAFKGGGTASIWASLESAEEQEVTVISREQVLRRERPFSPLDDPTQQYQLMVESFADSVLLDTPVSIPPSESIANMKVLDRIREASR
jgi:xylose dehydrogenase (NAD/NADP)